MRLIDANTLELRSFNDNEIPEYAILSHTWGSDEISYQELVWINRIKTFSSSFRQSSVSSSFASTSSQDEQSGLMLASMEMLLRGNWNSGTTSSGVAEQELLKRSGYSKITNAAKIAKRLSLEWIWIDTCCIDKSSSAELQEAINSMYRWYWSAEVCIVYLSDIETPPANTPKTLSQIGQMAFESSRWTKRGWTLQELVASVTCRFYFQDWTCMGNKADLVEELCDVTGIPISVLEDPRSIQEVSVAERMSWAANRETTRLEDLGYCLLGLFDIQMPLLYGEGEKAFLRLQEEILKTTDDYSLFAWSATTTDTSMYRGLLARSPLEFQYCGSVEREPILSTFPISSTAIGLRVQLEFLPDPNNKKQVLAMIRSCNAMNQRLAIHLKCLDDSMQYARVNAGSLVAIDDWPTGQLRNVYVRQNLQIPADFTTTEFSHFHVRRRSTKDSVSQVRIISASPHDRWNWDKHEFRISSHTSEVTAMFLLRVESVDKAHSISFPVAVGFNRKTCHYWCKGLDTRALDLDQNIPHWWQDAATCKITDEVRNPRRGRESHHDLMMIRGIGINIDIKAGLCGDRIALLVHIDGLVTPSRTMSWRT
ncbi:hypothetical protein CC86DRAFT_95609 [Ophiobolus disseminans]|uniref:Uncharacterized protein n=1 Tax=Ophiobolus disseminans TaxID=1469910 RepID=A0A6A6ZLY6_9PLEO|nr:hypothetical protein CC86DRAFT_95609 [Ophiobolus disseminans]